MKTEKSAGAVIFCEDKFLVIRHNKGHWDFPKGHIEKGESEKEAAKREIKEETNLDVEFIEGFYEKVEYYPRKGVFKTVVFYLARGCGEVVLQKEELSDYRWLEFREAKKRLTYESAKELLEKAENFIGLHGL